MQMDTTGASTKAIKLRNYQKHIMYIKNLTSHMPIHWIDKNKYTTKLEILHFFLTWSERKILHLNIFVTLPDKTEVIHIARILSVKICCTKQPKYLAKRWLICLEYFWKQEVLNESLFSNIISEIMSVATRGIMDFKNIAKWSN